MTWLIEPGIVFLIIIGVIWLLIRSDRQRHQGRHPIRRSNSYTDSTLGSPVMIGDDSHERNSRHRFDHSFDHRHSETDSSSGSHHHNSDSSSSDSGGDSSGGDSGGGGD
ncbi:hypothetical protein P9222_01960 [Paenibacillus amylolyticus]|nr:hypothetical protein [Paenibacillus amylolyticus]WFR63206.1 hypothetical protein P9222_01960 [Paenibacillus amylolyticus]